MGYRFRRRTIAGAALALALLLGGRTLAQGGGFSIGWWSVDGGGGTSSGGAYSLSGSSGQPDAGRQSGGAWTLEGGFWTGAAQARQLVYIPLLRR